MATPLKPWERGGSGYRPSGPPGAAATGVGEKKENGSYSPQRPVVPPRPATTSMTFCCCYPFKIISCLLFMNSFVSLRLIIVALEFVCNNFKWSSTFF